MAYTRNSNIPWSRLQVRQLQRLANENTPLIVICLKTGRSKSAIRTRASREGISLRYRNQRPYSRRT